MPISANTVDGDAMPRIFLTHPGRLFARSSTVPRTFAVKLLMPPTMPSTMPVPMPVASAVIRAGNPAMYVTKVLNVSTTNVIVADTAPFSTSHVPLTMFRNVSELLYASTSAPARSVSPITINPIGLRDSTRLIALMTPANAIPMPDATVVTTDHAACAVVTTPRPIAYAFVASVVAISASFHVTNDTTRMSATRRNASPAGVADMNMSVISRTACAPAFAARPISVSVSPTGRPFSVASPNRASRLVAMNPTRSASAS